MSLLEGKMAEGGVKKRKRTVLTIEKKIEILDQLKDKSITKLASDYGVGVSTVSDLKRNEEKVRSFIFPWRAQALLKRGR